jgi:hypothetical protein
MNYASNLLEAKHHRKGETTNCWLFGVFSGSALVKTPMVRVLATASQLRAFQPRSVEAVVQ